MKGRPPFLTVPGFSSNKLLYEGRRVSFLECCDTVTDGTEPTFIVVLMLSMEARTCRVLCSMAYSRSVGGVTARVVIGVVPEGESHVGHDVAMMP